MGLHPDAVVAPGDRGLGPDPLREVLGPGHEGRESGRLELTELRPGLGAGPHVVGAGVEPDDGLAACVEERGLARRVLRVPSHWEAGGVADGHRAEMAGEHHQSFDQVDDVHQGGDALDLAHRLQQQPRATGELHHRDAGQLGDGLVDHHPPTGLPAALGVKFVRGAVFEVDLAAGELQGALPGAGPLVHPDLESGVYVVGRRLLAVNRHLLGRLDASDGSSVGAAGDLREGPGLHQGLAVSLPVHDVEVVVLPCLLHPSDSVGVLRSP